MPRYQYYCEACEKEYTIIHLMKETPEVCKICKVEGSLKKIYPTLRKTRKKTNNKKPGEIVKKHIEEAKEEVKKEKERMKKEEYRA